MARAGEQPWPQLAADTAEVGVLSFPAAPLGAEGDVPRVGSPNLYSRDPEGFRDHDAVLVQVLVDRASRAILRGHTGATAPEDRTTS